MERRGGEERRMIRGAGDEAVGARCDDGSVRS